MHRIKIFVDSETTFVKELSFALPVFDGTPGFSIDQALSAIGGRKLGDNEWNTELNVLEVADYLLVLSRSEKDTVTTGCQWVRKHLLKRILDSLPFQGTKVDWKSLSEQVESKVATEFPLYQ
jgi:hypothetical protein